MEVKELEEAIHKWRREMNGEYPSVITIHPEAFYKLASDKDADHHITLHDDDGRILYHKFNGIPLIITPDEEHYKIYSEEEHKQMIQEN